jgi:hypothetical protein
VFELMNRQPLMSTGGTLTPGSLQGDVEFKDVSFAYTARPDVQVGGGGRPVHFKGPFEAPRWISQNFKERIETPVECQARDQGCWEAFCAAGLGRQ